LRIFVVQYQWSKTSVHHFFSRSTTTRLATLCGGYLSLRDPDKRGYYVEANDCRTLGRKIGVFGKNAKGNAAVNKVDRAVEWLQQKGKNGGCSIIEISKKLKQNRSFLEIFRANIRQILIVFNGNLNNFKKIPANSSINI
jgi:hypothetical protein